MTSTLKSIILLEKQKFFIYTDLKEIIFGHIVYKFHFKQSIAIFLTLLLET